MAKKKHKRSKPGRSSGKLGSDPQAIHEFGGKGDFGAPAGDQDRGTRDYVSRSTKRSDRGAAQPESFEHMGRRNHGALSPDSGPGSGSGGDLDTDIIGVGTGGSGLAQSPPAGHRPGPDDSTGSSDEMASGPHARGKHQKKDVGKIGGPSPVYRSIAQSQADAEQPGQGADSATNPDARQDDSFTGEISSSEASGRDENQGG